MKTKTKNFLDRLCFNFLVLCLALYSPANLAAEQEIAGRVVAVNGEVNAIDSAGSSRQLRRRSEFYAGEIIVTQPASFAQIRMTDSAIVSLKESTQFEILAYSYQNPSQADVSTMRLIEGGFRTITGQIGEQDRDAYSVETEYATIGIRGTDHEGVIVDGTLFTGVYDGGTELENPGGILELGVGADFDFAQADDPTVPPQGLTLQPPELGNIPVLNVADPEGEGDDGDGDDGAGDDGAGDDGAGDDDGGDDGAGDDGGGDDAAGDGDDGGGDNGDGADGDSGGGDGDGDSGGGDGGGGAGAAPTLTLADTQAVTGVDASGAGAAQETNAIQVNPNETAGDGILDCALNTNNPVCRPEEDAEPEPEPEPEP